jgi:5'-deoxynucleotidase YfbR-like HD superfamily hydrolase
MALLDASCIKQLRRKSFRMTDTKQQQKEKGRNVVAQLINDVTSHRYFDMWCTTSRASYLEASTAKEFDAIENLIKTLRYCFTAMVKDMTKDEFAATLAYFRDERNMELTDLLEEAESTTHYVTLKLDNQAGTLYIYNSDISIGR